MDSSGLPSMLMQAAQSAAEADGVVPNTPEDKKAEGVDVAASAAAASAVVNNGGDKAENKDEASGEGNDGMNKDADETPAPVAAPQAPPMPSGGDTAALNQIISNMNGGDQNQIASAIMGAGGGAAIDPSAGMAAAAAQAQAQQQQQAQEQVQQPKQLEAQQQALEQQAQQQQVAQPTPPARAPAAEPKKRAPLRRGKWTPEEEAYANRLIQEFKAGLLPLTDGTTLRTFLSKLLNCDPMRISKKFVGSNCIGKQVFRRRGADVNNLTPDEIEKTRFELSELEKKFLDRVAQNKSSKGGGGGGGGGSSNKSSKMSGMSSSSGGGGGLSGMNNMNKSAAAVGRALLQGNKAPQDQAPQSNNIMDGGNSSAGGLLAQLQAQQPGMFDNNTARSFLNAGGNQAGGLGNMNSSASITNLMLQTGMSRDQISQLAQKGISSSASLANMLGKQRSFDQLMSLDFQSMQSIDNLANLIQAGMPNSASGLGGRIPKGQMKNMDWGTQGVGGQVGNHVAAAGQAALLSSSASGVKSSIENLVRTLSANSGNSGNNAQGFNNSMHNNNMHNQANATNFGNFLQNASQQGSMAAAAAGQGGGSQGNDLSNIIQSLTQQQNQQNQGTNNVNYSNLFQGMAGGMGGSTASLLQNNNANIGQGFNQNLDLMNMLGQSAGNLSQAQNLNPLMQQLTSDQFGGAFQNATNQGNPMMAALAQQQLLAQAGGGNSISNLLGQHNGLAGLAGMNNSLSNFGASLGGNLGGNLSASLGGSNFGGGAGQQNNTTALLQQLIAQQNGGGGGNNNQASQGNDQGGDGGGNKRSIDDVNGGDGDGGSSKKQQTVSL